MELSITNYGANIVSILVPDNKGQVADVVLGYDSLEGYEINNTFLVHLLVDMQIELVGQVLS